MKRHGFTLIELLVVIVIAGIMLSIVVVGVTRLQQATKLQTAASNLVNTFHLARQYAIANRVTTKVIFAINPTPSDLSTTNLVFPFTSYAVVAKPGGGSLYHSSLTTNDWQSVTNWTYLTNWKRLPAGVVFDFTWWNAIPQFGVEEGDWLNPASPTNRAIDVTWINFPSNNTAQIEKVGSIYFEPTLTQWGNVFIRDGFFDPNGDLSGPAYGRVFTPSGATVTNVNHACIQVWWPLGRIVLRKPGQFYQKE